MTSETDKDLLLRVAKHLSAETPFFRKAFSMTHAEARTISRALREAAEGWRPIETAPKHTLICIWITGAEVLGRKWCADAGEFWANCYYDSICDEWRTSRPSGHLRAVPARFVTHWRPLPPPPSEGATQSLEEDR